MPSLREIQTLCHDAFSGAADPIPGAVFVDNAIPARARVAVYRNNAREVFRGVLANAYPVVEALVGPACFRSLAAALRRRHPSRSGDLQDFLRSFPGLLTELYSNTVDFAYLPDVAALELAIEDSMLAKEVEPLPLERLGQIPAGQLTGARIALVPSLQIVRSAFPILDVWRAHQSEPVATVALSSGGQNVAVQRHGPQAELRLLDDDACALARALGAGRALGQACDELTPLVGADGLSRALHTLFSQGCVGAIALP